MKKETTLFVACVLNLGTQVVSQYLSLRALGNFGEKNNVLLMMMIVFALVVRTRVGNRDGGFAVLHKSEMGVF